MRPEPDQTIPDTTSTAFDLPADRAAKADPALISADEHHFRAMSDSITRSVADATTRLDSVQKSPARMGQEVMERDMEIHRLTGRIRSLRRYGLDLCLGSMVDARTGEAVYIGRTGLLDASGDQLLIDWRSPAAEPFFGATHANPMGLARRRRYRWTGGRVTDYWDEVFVSDELDSSALEPRAALDDQSSFIASLGTSRSPRMRDVLGTIQSDQDAIIRAGSDGALVVDGGPGTGKTVVALHRTAYLLYSDPRLGHNRGGVLFVGPHKPYLAYVSDVLPSLGEEGVSTCTIADLVAEGDAAAGEDDPRVARLKSSAEMVQAIDAAVRFYEQPPTKGMVVETDWVDIELSAEDWAEAFDAPDPDVPHNEAREHVRELLVTILLDKYEGDVSRSVLRKALVQNDELRSALDGAWTIVEAADLVGDLWSVPAYLRRCAPWLTPEEVQLLQRTQAQRWTSADLPLLDAARRRLGDPDAVRLQMHRARALEAERRRMDRVVEELLELDDEDGLMAQLRQEGIRDALVDDAAAPSIEPDRLAGPFAHIVVDEAQELTDAEWQMLLQRCPSRSLTIVGDRAQARRGFTESWSDRLERVGIARVTMSSLTVNYRTPSEVMEEATPVIRSVLPDANVPTSVRSSGISVHHGSLAELGSIVDEWSTMSPAGIGCVIGHPAFEATARVRSLSPQSAKGLEFDLVVIVDPEAFGDGVEGAVDRYVAMTRATQRLVILTR